MKESENSTDLRDEFVALFTKYRENYSDFLKSENEFTEKGNELTEKGLWKETNSITKRFEKNLKMYGGKGSKTKQEFQNRINYIKNKQANLDNQIQLKLDKERQFNLADEISDGEYKRLKENLIVLNEHMGMTVEEARNSANLTITKYIPLSDAFSNPETFKATINKYSQKVEKTQKQREEYLKLYMNKRTNAAEALKEMQTEFKEAFPNHNNVDFNDHFKWIFEGKNKNTIDNKLLPHPYEERSSFKHSNHKLGRKSDHSDYSESSILFFENDTTECFGNKNQIKLSNSTVKTEPSNSEIKKVHFNESDLAELEKFSKQVGSKRNADEAQDGSITKPKKSKTNDSCRVM